MKKRSRYLSLFLVLVLLVAALAGCTTSNQPASEAAPQPDAATGQDAQPSGSGEGGKLRIGISIGFQQQERSLREIETFQQYAESAGVELIIQSAEEDVQKQISQCENMISTGIDVLIVHPIDSASAGVICAPAKEAGIPVIAYDVLIQNGELDYYVSFDSYKVGLLQAEMVVDLVPQGNYIWLKGDPANHNAQLIASAHEEVLRPYIDSGDINIVTEQWCTSWSADEAMKHTENGLTSSGNDVQAVLCPNDGTATGAVQALVAQNMAGDVATCGQDGDLAACQRIVEGTQVGTVYKPVRELATAAIQLAIGLAEGKRGDEAYASVDSALGEWNVINNNTRDVDFFQVEIVPVYAHNMMDTIIADGFHSYEDVYANIPEEDRPARP